jgi:hypothetical protein
MSSNSSFRHYESSARGVYEPLPDNRSYQFVSIEKQQIEYLSLGSVNQTEHESNLPEYKKSEYILKENYEEDFNQEHEDVDEVHEEIDEEKDINISINNSQSSSSSSTLHREGQSSVEESAIVEILDLSNDSLRFVRNNYLIVK